MAAKNGNSKLVNPKDYSVPSEFVDGFEDVTIGAAVAKLSLFSIVGKDEKNGTEMRRHVRTIVVPTASLFEFCRHTLRGLQANEDAMKLVIDQHFARIMGQSSDEVEPVEDPKSNP